MIKHNGPCVVQGPLLRLPIDVLTSRVISLHINTAWTMAGYTSSLGLVRTRKPQP